MQAASWILAALFAAAGMASILGALGRARWLMGSPASFLAALPRRAARPVALAVGLAALAMAAALVSV